MAGKSTRGCGILPPPQMEGLGSTGRHAGEGAGAGSSHQSLTTNSAAHRIISVPGHLPWSWCVGQRSVLIQARETWLLDNIQRRDRYHYLQGLVPRRACRLRASPPPTRWTAPGLCRSTAPSHAPHTPACTPAMQARRPSNPAIGLGPHVACLAQDVGVWPPEQ